MTTKYSRRGETNPDGKLDCELKLRIPQSLDEAINANCARVGINKSEYTRIKLQISEFGLDYVLSLHAKQIMSVAAMGNIIKPVSNRDADQSAHNVKAKLVNIVTNAVMQELEAQGISLGLTEE